MTTELRTFTEMRASLGFGVRRLKILLALRQLPELDDPDWQGTLTYHLGPRGQVACDPHRTPREIRVPELPECQKTA